MGDAADLGKLAWFYSQNPQSEPAALRFREALESIADVEQLEQLAQTYAPYEDIALPIHLRLCCVQPENLDARISLGFAYYMNGRDEEAQNCATQALETDRSNVRALNLQAALAKDDAMKRSIYARILTIDPHNRAAFDNLVLIRATSEKRS